MPSQWSRIKYENHNQRYQHSSLSQWSYTGIGSGESLAGQDFYYGCKSTYSVCSPCVRSITGYLEILVVCIFHGYALCHVFLNFTDAS